MAEVEICSGARNGLVIMVAAIIEVYWIYNGCAQLWLNIYCNSQARKRNT